MTQYGRHTSLKLWFLFGYLLNWDDKMHNASPTVKGKRMNRKEYIDDDYIPKHKRHCFDCDSPTPWPPKPKQPWWCESWTRNEKNQFDKEWYFLTIYMYMRIYNINICSRVKCSYTSRCGSPPNQPWQVWELYCFLIQLNQLEFPDSVQLDFIHRIFDTLEEMLNDAMKCSWLPN